MSRPVKVPMFPQPGVSDTCLAVSNPAALIADDSIATIKWIIGFPGSLFHFFAYCWEGGDVGPFVPAAEMEKLVACVQKKPGALCRLICFPWAGGGTSQLARWGRLFNDSVEVFCIRLPGRESRLEEPFAKDMTSVVNEVTSVLLKELKEKPFALFGHSFGTYMSLAIALHLKEKYGLEPVHLFVSSAHAPNSAGHLTLKNGTIPDDDDDFLTCMEILGTSYDIPQDEYIRKNVVATSRADSRVFQTFSLEKTEKNIPFSCDLTYFYGSDDKIYDAQGWRELTRGDTSFYQLPGDHFYLLKPSNESFLIKHMTRCIENANL